MRKTGFDLLRLLCLILAAAACLLGAPALAEEGGLRICAVMTRNNEAVELPDGTCPDFVEVENASQQRAWLNGCALVRADIPMKAFVFPNTALEPGARVRIYADERLNASVEGELHSDFRLPASGFALELLDAGGNVIDRVEVPALEKDELYCLDGDGIWQRIPPAADPEEADAEDIPAPEASPEALAGLHLTEIVPSNATYWPDEDGECTDYVEILNDAGAAVPLTGWYLSDDPAEPLKWRFPQVTLAAGERIVVHCSGKDRAQDPSHLHTGFRISRSGGSVFLTAPDETLVEEIAYPALETDQSCSLTASGWSAALRPTPGLANTEENETLAHDEILRRNAFGVCISEILTAGSGEDWIELYNAGPRAADLSGWGLSDDVRHPRDWQFPQGTVLDPGSCLIVYASGAEDPDGAGLNAGFRLSVAGGYSVVLAEPGGRIVDRVWLEKQHSELSCGRVNGTGAIRYFTDPTPGAVNPGNGYLGQLDAPYYSLPGGLYESGRTLEISLTAPAGSRIYYTLDCSDPSDAKTLYTSPIPVSGNTILRTRVYRDGYLTSPMDTQSYLFGVNNGGGTVLVFSLVSEVRNLTDSKYGIMTNPYQQWEREGHIEIFAPDGSTVISQECGIRLHGEGSRELDEKTFAVIARKIYGSNRFRAPLFSYRPYTEYQSFLLRPSSEDSTMTRMRDAVLQTLARDTSVLYQEAEIGVLYIDGRFWGHYNLRERINTAAICQFEGWEGQEDDLDLVKSDKELRQGSDETMKKLLSYVRKADMTSDEAYQALDSAIDIQNYIEYMALEIFTGNTDTLNVKRYRNRNTDGRWRWALYDLDWAFYSDTNSITRWLKPGGAGRGQATDNTLFIACMKNPVFRDRFLTHLGREMATTFSTESVKGRIMEFYERLKPILPDTFARWGLSQEDYDHYLHRFVQYAETRPTRMLQFLKYDGTLKLSKEQMERYFGDAMRAASVSYDSLKKP
ncbi:MAG: lamin tail domain-containing protein [Clostridia bacterium]|nr:lamin tail domain-containing protein [Clostridia bacterium]